MATKRQEKKKQPKKQPPKKKEEAVSEEDDDDGWMNVCEILPFEKRIKDERFWPATYYVTHGGGPEGGYIVMPNGDVYYVTRDWLQPFVPVKQHGMRLDIKTDDIGTEVRLVPKSE